MAFQRAFNLQRRQLNQHSCSISHLASRLVTGQRLAQGYIPLHTRCNMALACMHSKWFSHNLHKAFILLIHLTTEAPLRHLNVASTTADFRNEHHKLQCLWWSARDYKRWTQKGCERNAQHADPLSLAPLMSTTRAPYAGTRRKLAIAFDVGTTYSGISYRCVPDIWLIYQL